MHSPPEPITEPAPAGTLWRHRNFLLLWAGQSISEMGSAVTQLALPLTAVVILQASTFQVGLLTSAATAAFALTPTPSPWRRCCSSETARTLRPGTATVPG